ncbi:AAA family ATPase, partial [Parabacteroides distasonis]|uniref:AAA family ATPase n=1 Tax=Parabacteroides distasonis TaxID=823 RepID=UPI001F04AE3A
MSTQLLYNDFPTFLRKYFPYKVQKISLNAGFTCPNRDGTKGWGGCTYCNNQTFNPDYCRTEKSVTTQLEEGKCFFAHKYPEMKYLAYFQAYTNTYAELEGLKRKYEEALAVDGVVGLVIGTRPDCMPESLLRYLEELNKHLEIWEREYGSHYGDRAPEERFFHVIRLAYEKTGQRVVILVDEYDKPMLQAIEDDRLQQVYRNQLKPFYGVMKSMDSYIKFAFLTGVTKFGKISVFSDLNNLNDISMNPDFAAICGMTEKEIHHYFDLDIHTLATKEDLTYDETVELLRDNYDGYHFTENSEGIYNPFSLLNTFYAMRPDSYWFATGTPSFLVYLLQRSRYDLWELEEVETDSDVLDSIDSFSKNPIPVIYQSGYLTIKGYDKRFKLYTLGFPNLEVKEGFFKYLLPYYADVKETDTTFNIRKFVGEVETGDYDSFFSRLQTFFSNIPYDLVGDLEKHYQNVLYIISCLMGFYVDAEYHTNRGRADLILKTPAYIYIMEFKLNGTLEEAIR